MADRAYACPNCNWTNLTVLRHQAHSYEECDLPARLANWPKLAIVGPSGAGKDEAADWLAAHTPLLYAGSTSRYLIPYYVSRRTGRPLEEVRNDPAALAEAYANRHAVAMELKRLGVELRTAEPLVVIKPALARGHILVGLRDGVELRALRKQSLVDLVVWMQRDVPADPTLDFGPELADVVIDNDGTKDRLHGRLGALCRFARIPLRA